GRLLAAEPCLSERSRPGTAAPTWDLAHRGGAGPGRLAGRVSAAAYAPGPRRRIRPRSRAPRAVPDDRDAAPPASGRRTHELVGRARWRNASYRTSEPATEALRDSMLSERIGMWMSASQVSDTSLPR